MRLDKIIYLLSESGKRDAAGYPTGPVTITKRETFAKKKSVKRAEFYAANQSGKRADAVFEVWISEYRNERLLEFEGKQFEIIRTYETSTEFIELTCSDLSQGRGA